MLRRYYVDYAMLTRAALRYYYDYAILLTPLSPILRHAMLSILLLPCLMPCRLRECVAIFRH